LTRTKNPPQQGQESRLFEDVWFSYEVVETVVYPNAIHSFDGTVIGDGWIEDGHFLRHDTKATFNAVNRVTGLFAIHLGD